MSEIPQRDYLTSAKKYDSWPEVKKKRKGLDVPSGKDDPIRLRRVDSAELFIRMFNVRGWLADEHNFDDDQGKHWYAKLKRNSVVTLSFAYSALATYPPTEEETDGLLDVEFVFGRPVLNFVSAPDLPSLDNTIKLGDMEEPIRIGLRANEGSTKGGIAYCHFHISSNQTTIHKVVHDLALSPKRFLERVQAVNQGNNLVEVLDPDKGTGPKPDPNPKRTLYTRDFASTVKSITFAPPSVPERAKVICHLGANVRSRTALFRLPEELLPPGLLPLRQGTAAAKETITKERLVKRLAADLDRLLVEDAREEDTDLPSCLMFTGPYTMDEEGNVIVNGEAFWAADWQNPEPPEEGGGLRARRTQAGDRKAGMRNSGHRRR